MAISIAPGYRSAAIGVASAALLVGAFTLGASRAGSSAAGGTPGGTGSGTGGGTTLTAASGQPARITVTGNGTVNGVPNQLILSMGVQVTADSVSAALSQANQGVRNVTAALTSRGVAASDIQTSGLNIWPNYNNNSQYPTSYGVSESLTANLDQLSAAGSQINAAVRAGGNTVTISGVSLNLTNTSSLMAAARTSAIADARTQARQFAAAMGEPLGPVISITPVQQQQAVVPDENGTAFSKSSAVPISPGTQQVTVSVTVVFAA